MALNRTNLIQFDRGALSPAGDRHLGLYHYATNDSAAVTATAGYFDGAASVLRKGDTINAVCDFSGTPTLRTFVVTARTATTVTFA